METVSKKRSWSLMFPVSLLSLVACGAPATEAPAEESAPRAAEARLEGGWQLAGTWRGGGSGTASAFMQLAPTGDENGDGVDDVVLGLPGARVSDTAQGKVVILSGTDFSLLKTIESQAIESFGYGVTGLGDINDDGQLDYGVGAPVILNSLGQQSYQGRVYVLRSDGSGGYERSLIQDDVEGGYFGRSLVFAGGNKSVLVVSRPLFKGGRALGYATKYEHKNKPLFAGSQDAVDNDVENERRGYQIQLLGDLDGDGTRDFAMNASGQSPVGASTYPYPGRVYVHSGRTGELIKAVQGPEARTQMGMFTSEIDDINGDGVRELLFGAPYHRQGGIFMAGVAYVVDGAAVRAPGNKLLSLAEHPEAILRQHAGTSSVSLTGFSTSNLFDIDGDGVEEYAVGQPGVSLPGKSLAGRVLVFSGRTGEQLHALEGDVAGTWFGEGLQADPKARTLSVAMWHADRYFGRVELYRWTLVAAQP